jgi:ribosomal protein S18 acetylase RimI-like enzyme
VTPDRSAAPRVTAGRISLRPETTEDDEFLRALYASTRAHEVAVTGWTAAQQDVFLRSQFDLQRHHYRAHYPGATFDIILLDAVPVGRIYVHRADAEIRLMDVALVPAARGYGIGTLLVERLLAAAAVRNAAVTLNVEPYNPARRLYERLGFRIVEEDPTNLFMQWRPAAPIAACSRDTQC